MKPCTLDAEALRTALEGAGRRYTRQRSEVYSVLSQTDHHPTAEEVYEGVRQTIPNISLATVYKALEALVASGVATKLPDPQGSARYDARGEGHYHLRCLRSGRVEDLPTEFDAELIAKLDPELGKQLACKGFHLTGYRLELVGYFEAADPVARDLDADEVVD